MLSGPDLWDVSCFEFWQTTQTISNLKSLLLDVDKIFELFILSSSLPKYFLWLFFGLCWAQWFLLIGLMDYCDQIFLFFLIFPVILSLLQSVMILMTLLYLWHDCRDTFVGWVPCQDCLTSWCLTSPSVLTLGSCSAAVIRLRWEMKGRYSILILIHPN